MNNVLINILKEKEYSYEELKIITSLDDRTLSKLISNLFDKKYVKLIDNKYTFLQDNYILDIIKTYKPSINNINKIINIFKKEEIKKIVDKLERDVKIFINTKNEYEVVNENHIVGIIERNSNNKSFIRDKKNNIILIPSENLNTALKFDKVIVERTYQNKGKVIKILNRKNNKLVCEVKEYNNKLILVPFNGNVEIKLNVTNKDILKDLIIGDRVYVFLENIINENNSINVTNITKIGHFNDQMNDAIAVAISKDFDIDFPKGAIEEAEKIPDKVRNEDKENRLDLTRDAIFTIDSITTKDMDDAVSIKKLPNKNYLVSVHIAGVSHYIKPHTKLFESAYKRGTSLYLDDYVIPMLPSILSNGICSLNEGVDRLTKSVIMEMDNKGNIVRYKITDAVIESKKKMTYEELNDLFAGKDVDLSYNYFINDLALLREVSNILTQKRIRQGNIDFKSSDIKINKDVFKNDTIIGFEGRESGEAQKIIENIMILANEVVAYDFYIKKLPFIYRVHSNPNELKIDNTLDIISNIENKIINVNNIYGQKGLQKLLNEFKDTKDYQIVSNLLLRSMSKAKYSVDNIGHFALASDYYCHFTSPIRRFPDLVIHTLLDKFDNNNKKTEIDNMDEILNEIAIHSSYKERQADDAEKDYLKLKMAEYMQDHINEEFTGIILDIDKDKIFIKLDNNIKGILDPNGNFCKSFSVDTVKRQLKSNYSKQTVTLGAKIKVKVTKVNIPQKEIYFDIKELIKNNNNKKLELKNK